CDNPHCGQVKLFDGVVSRLFIIKQLQEITPHFSNSITFRTLPKSDYSQLMINADSTIINYKL
ncbi:MAG: hypothetical protein ACR2MD_17670, partial [Aridibacter sp.]